MQPEWYWKWKTSLENHTQLVTWNTKSSFVINITTMISKQELKNLEKQNTIRTLVETPNMIKVEIYFGNESTIFFLNEFLVKLLRTEFEMSSLKKRTLQISYGEMGIKSPYGYTLKIILHINQFTSRYISIWSIP